MTRVQKLADELIGSSGWRAEQLAAKEDLNAAELAELDELMFECDGCGWICATEELNNDGGQQLCDDCAGA